VTLSSQDWTDSIRPIILRGVINKFRTAKQWRRAKTKQEGKGVELAKFVANDGMVDESLAKGLSLEGIPINIRSIPFFRGLNYINLMQWWRTEEEWRGGEVLEGLLEANSRESNRLDRQHEALVIEIVANISKAVTINNFYEPSQREATERNIMHQAVL
jgi:hypothetical protein